MEIKFFLFGALIKPWTTPYVFLFCHCIIHVISSPCMAAVKHIWADRVVLPKKIKTTIEIASTLVIVGISIDN